MGNGKRMADTESSKENVNRSIDEAREREHFRLDFVKVGSLPSLLMLLVVLVFVPILWPL